MHLQIRLSNGHNSEKKTTKHEPNETEKKINNEKKKQSAPY